MELTPELLGTGAVGAVVIISAIGNYIRALREQPRGLDAVVAGVGFGYGDREQTDRLITEVHGIRVAVEILADRRTEEFQEMHQELLERMDTQERRKEQEEQKPRRQPPRRR